MENNELKPCPFCGHKAISIYNEPENTIQIMCSYCNGNVGGYYVYFKHRAGSYEKTLNEAIEAWNNRADTPERLTNKEVKMINEEVKELE